MAVVSQVPHISVSKHQESNYDKLIALFHFATEVKRRLLKNHLERNDLNVCDLFKDKRQEMWLFEEIKLAFRKLSIVQPKDLSLNTLNYILIFYCNDLFWNSCLNDGKVTFEDFLNAHSSDIYDLTKCTNTDNSSTRVMPNLTLLSNENFKLLFNISYRHFGDRTGEFKAQKGIKLPLLNQHVHEVLLNAFSPLRRSVNCLTDDQRTICKTVVFKEEIKQEIWTSVENHSAAIAERYNKKKSELQKVQSLKNCSIDEKQSLENRRKLLEDALNDPLFLQESEFCDLLQQELHSLAEYEKLYLVKQLCCKEISIRLEHGQYRNGMYPNAVLDSADKEMECFKAVYCSQINATPIGNRQKKRKYDSEQIETHNYLKLIQLLKEVGRNAFIDVLKNRLPGACYGHAFEGMKQRLRPYLNNAEYQKLFPDCSVYSGDLTDLELSLLYIILRNLNTIPPHSNGWGNIPEEEDRSISANIDRIRIAKNCYVSHFNDCSLPYDTFKKAWEEYRQCIVELGGEQYKEGIDELLTSAINPLMEQDLIEAVESLKENERLKRQYVEKFEENLNKIKEEVKTLTSNVNAITHELDEKIAGRLPLTATLKLEGRNLPTVCDSERGVKQLDSEDVKVTSIQDGSIIFGLVIRAKSYQSVGSFLQVLGGFLEKIFSRPAAHEESNKFIIVSLEITNRNIRNMVPLSFQQKYAAIDIRRIRNFTEDIVENCQYDTLLKWLLDYCIITTKDSYKLHGILMEKEKMIRLLSIVLCREDSEWVPGFLFILYQLGQHKLLHKWTQMNDTERSMQPVNILPNPEEMVCLEGDSITLAEGAVSKEKVKVECYKDSDEQVGDIIVESKDTIYKVAIPKATVEHSGKYTIKIGDKTCETVVYVRERISSIELRAYQQELAEIASKGINTIICAGTNAGKTYVAFYVIENHLLRYPKGKAVFINKTNVLLEQQFRRARNNFESIMQHEINKWEAEINPEDQFLDMVNNSRLLFITPKSLSNRLEENTKSKVSIEDFSLIIFDECHHAHGSSLYSKVMSYYRILKFKKKSTHLPQILGLTASPGTNKANNVDSAVDHLKCLMANLDVKELSVVKQNEAELLDYSAKPDKVQITSTPRRIDPVKDIILDAISYVEKIFTSTKVLHFLASQVNETRGGFSAITKPPADKTGQSYVKWIADTKNEVENIMHIDRQIPRLLHACLCHLDLYSDCLEVNSLLEIEDVHEILRDGYCKQSFESQTANTDEEGDIVSKLRDVFTAVCQVGTDVERNPDISEISKRVEQEFIKLREESRFLIFVKKRTTAKALAERLPDHLKCTYLTGSHVSAADGGLSMAKQIEVVDEFKNGRYLCIVATSIACEGLDIQQCNLMIRYKFHADEISSLQMRGRIRQKGGTEVLLASSKDLERESQNIERQYLMNEAIKKVISRDLSNEIERAERVTYDMEEAERRTAKIKISNKIWGDFSAVCKVCGIAITDCKYIRRINGTHIIIIDKNVLTIIKRVPIKKVRKFDGIQKLDKVYGRDCGHNWGSILKYSECDFVSLSQDYVSIFDKSTNKFVKSEKWSDLPFKIQDVIEEEIFQYNA